MVSNDRQTTAEAQAFAQRLRQALEEAGIPPSPTVVAHEFNLRYWGRSISIHAARNWLLGVSLPRQDKLRVLADWLRVAPEALLLGSLPALPGDAIPHRTDRRALTAKLVHGAMAPPEMGMADQHMLQIYLRLSSESQRTVQAVVSACAALDASRAREASAQNPQAPTASASSAKQPHEGVPNTRVRY